MLEKQICKALGYESYKDIAECLGIKISLESNSYRGEATLQISYTDPFYSSYGQRSDVYPIIDGQLLSNDEIDKIKRIVAAKKKQSGLIAGIKLYAYEQIKKFMSESFDIPLEHIEESDITFKDWSSFWIAKQRFGFAGTLVRKEFIIYDHVHGSHKDNYKLVVTIKHYFHKKYEV